MWPNKAPALESIENKRSEPKADTPEESKEAAKEVTKIPTFLEPANKQVDENKIGVYTRIRPMFLKELLEKNLRQRSYIASDNVIQIEGKNTLCELFKCNKVFGEGSTQE